ncbi:cob(I)yrinic acid a,c-diamide adenosyltransferase [Bacteroidota bacterium]
MNSDWKIYTKKGDKGETSLLGGTRVPKFHGKIEAYGTIDELNSFIGLLRDQDIDKNSKDVLIKIQEELFEAEAILAADSEKSVEGIPRIKEDDIIFLEKEIDKMNLDLPELTSFILPGGHQTVSLCHVVRTICRRAERLTIKLAETYEIDDLIIKYLNRLSDYFFILARKFTQDYNSNEITWKPKR